MKRALRVFGMMTVAGLVMVGSAGAQEKKEFAPPEGTEMAFPKPGPEHEVLKRDAGVWDATVESTMEPGGTPTVSKAVETNTLLGDGLWLIQDFKGEFMGSPFEGHSVTGYDASKGKYVGTWVDSMAPGLTTMEGTYDPETRTMTSWMEGPCPTGIVMKMRSTCESKDSDTRVFTMFSPVGQGEEFPMMKITYKRRSSAAGSSATN